METSTALKGTISYAWPLGGEDYVTTKRGGAYPVEHLLGHQEAIDRLSLYRRVLSGLRYNASVIYYVLEKSAASPRHLTAVLCCGQV